MTDCRQSQKSKFLYSSSATNPKDKLDLPLAPQVTAIRTQLVNEASGVCWESGAAADSLRGQ